MHLCTDEVAAVVAAIPFALRIWAWVKFRLWTVTKRVLA